MEDIEIASVDQTDSVTIQVCGGIPLSLLETEISVRRSSLAPDGVSEVDIRGLTISFLVISEVQKALEDRQLQGVSAPEISLTPREQEGRIDFKASVSIYPRPDVVDYDRFVVELVPTIVDDQRVDVVLQEMAVAHVRTSGMKDWVIDDKFAKEMAPEFESLAELKQQIRQEEEDLVAQSEITFIRDAVFEEIITRNPFAIPQVLVDEEIRGFLVAEGRVTPSNDDFDVSEIPVDNFRAEYQERAEKRARLTVIIDRLSEIEDIHPNEEDIEQAIVEISELHESSYEAAYEYLEENGFILEVVLAVTQEKVFQFLLDRTEVTYGQEH